MNTDETDTPEEVTTPRSDGSICFVPSQYFFVEEIPIDSTINSDEKAAFFELQLETLAPLPTDQLFWGYYSRPNSESGILYASVQSRLHAEGYDALNEYTWVLPQFIPELALGLRRPEELTQLEVLSEQKAIVDYSVDLSKTHGIRILEDSESDDVDASESGVIEIEAEQLWSADIRPAAFKEKAKRERIQTAFINKSVRYSFYAFGFLLFAEIVLFAANLGLKTYASKIEAQAPIVRRIEDQHSLINKLEQISQNELRPIALLEKANDIRIKISKDIIYDTVDIVGENEVTIKGTVGSVNQLNRYVSELALSKHFQVIEDPKYITRGGKTTFTLKMFYLH